MARDLAHHISRIPAKALPSGFLEEAALHGSASDILARHSMASLMRRYSALLRVHLKHTEARLSKMDQEAALKRKRLEVRSRYRMECFCEGTSARTSFLHRRYLSVPTQFGCFSNNTFACFSNNTGNAICFCGFVVRLSLNEKLPSPPCRVVSCRSVWSSTFYPLSGAGD